MGSLPDPKSQQTLEELVADLRRGDLQVLGAFDVKLETQPTNGAEARRLRTLTKLHEKIETTIRPNRPCLVMVLEARPTREALERTIQELRECLEECADEKDGWPNTGVADRFEASRELVPEDLPDDDAGDDAARESQADFYPRSRYGPKL